MRGRELKRAPLESLLPNGSRKSTQRASVGSEVLLLLSKYFPVDNYKNQDAQRHDQHGFGCDKFGSVHGVGLETEPEL